MESMNPSGTGKDRAVQYMLKEAMKHPSYGPNVSIIEGTSGSTGIALAFQCNALLGAQNTNKPVAANTVSKTDASSSIGMIFVLWSCFIGTCTTAFRFHLVPS